MGSSSRNSHDTLWLWLPVKFPVLVQLQQTKQTAPRKGYGNYFVFLLVFPVKCFLSRGTEKGRKEPHARCEQVTEASGLQKTCRLHLGISSHLPGVLPVGVHLLPPASRCLQRNDWQQLEAVVRVKKRGGQNVKDDGLVLGKTFHTLFTLQQWVSRPVIILLA